MTPVELQQLMKRRRPFTAKEAADIIGMGVHWLYSRIGKPEGPPYNKRGRTYRFPCYEFIQWSRQTETP